MIVEPTFGVVTGLSGVLVPDRWGGVEVVVFRFGTWGCEGSRAPIHVSS
jgi:hypothetical protein